MFEKEAMLKQLEGKTNEEKIQIIQEKMGANLPSAIPTTTTPCKFWCSQVFTYCHISDFQCQLNSFLCWMNMLASCGYCFKPEDTVYLGCDCPCGYKQVILYYTMTFPESTNTVA